MAVQNSSAAQCSVISQPVAYLIPGIGIDYLSMAERLQSHPLFRKNCGRAGIPAKQTQPFRRLLEEDTIESQILAYTVNCTLCDINREERGIIPRVIVGYSMGIYPALYAAGFCSFETGAWMIEGAYRIARRLCRSSGKRFGMGAVLGLTASDLRELVLSEAEDLVEIAIYNGKRSFVIAGEEEEVERRLEMAAAAGALSARRLSAVHPYHTSFLRGTYGKYRRYLCGFQYAAGESVVISLIDGRPVQQDSVPEAVASAFCTPLRFEEVLNRVISDYGLTDFFELGPDDSMKKLARYVSRAVRVLPV